MKVLVACEFSGTVRDAFTKLGHDATSCDLLDSLTPGKHYRGDVRDILGNGWDLMIAHPPCTYLSASGMHWTKRGLRDPKLTEDALDFVKTLLNADIRMIALENPISIISTRIRKPDQIIQPWYFGDDASKKTCLWLKNLPKLNINLKNIVPPKGWLTVKSAIDMSVCANCEEPFCDEHEAHYAECSCLGPTEDDVTYKSIDGVLFGTREAPANRPIWANQTPGGQNKLGPSPDRWKERSKTYKGIAEAMAVQWGNLPENFTDSLF